MTRTIWPIFMLLLAACSSGLPRVDSVTLSRGVDPATYAAVDPVTTFSADDEVWHAVVAVADLEKNAVVSARWYRGQKQLTAPQRIEMPDGGGGHLDFALELPSHPSGGEYRVDVYLADTLVNSVAFSLPARPPAIHSATLTRSVGPNSAPTFPTTTFSPSEDFITSVEISDMKLGSQLSAKWYYGDQSIAEPTVIPIQEDGAAGFVSFTLTSPGAWLAGEYRVEIELDGEMKAAESFSIQ